MCIEVGVASGRGTNHSIMSSLFKQSSLQASLGSSVSGGILIIDTAGNTVTGPTRIKLTVT